MPLSPDFAAFSKTYEEGNTQVVFTKLIADLVIPVSAMIKLVKGVPDSFLLESVEDGSIRGRYSFLGMKPDLIWRCFGDKAEINRIARKDRTAFTRAVSAISVRTVIWTPAFRCAPL